MTCRVEVFVRSGHTIDLALEDGEDRTFAQALREAWASPEAIEFTHLALAASSPNIPTRWTERQGGAGPHLVALVRAGATFANGKLVERPDETPQPEAA
jgi:hypothetical protein